MLYRNYKGQIVGELKGDYYYKDVDSRKHFMYKFNGYGIDKHIIKQLSEAECKGIYIREKDTGDIYFVDMATFVANAVEQSYQTIQLFINIKNCKLV